MNNPTFSNRWNLELIDGLYAQWQEDPNTVDDRWKVFFEGFELGNRNGHSAEISTNGNLQAYVIGAIYAYRSLGHTQAKINPLYLETPENERLSLKRLGIKETDLDQLCDTGNYKGGDVIRVRELIDGLKETYCQSMGVEYLHVQETSRRRWLQAEMEPIRNRPEHSKDKKIRALDRIIQAETFEKFLHTRYVGQKRFGLEGGETLIAAIDSLIETAPENGVEEIIMGMAHRGRLNVLANILEKPYEMILHEFGANYLPDTTHGDGDVKYHLGYDSIVKNSKGESIMLQLAANPSHLEAVNPIVEGRARARQRIIGDKERKRVLPLLMHGDAAFAGQGIVAEVLNFSQLKGYKTGGTIHIVINNQIGFTTDPSEARSTLYCTDVAKMIEAPIFHVNGDDPMTVIWAMDMALRYRQEFGSDVVIDMLCYRRFGHNEADEPAFTQPKMYRQIKDHKPVSVRFSENLKKNGIIDDNEETGIRDKWLNTLDTAFQRVKDEQDGRRSGFEGSTAVYQPAYHFEPGKTPVTQTELRHVAETITSLPEGFNPNPKIKRLLDQKRKAFEENKGIDWAFAESLAWGTLMMEGTPVRLSGQDCERGTFSHRHSVIHDIKTGEKIMPLMEMPGRRAMICVHNSLLSEAAVLGYDFGYSLDYPQMLCMWEAQFGDFANGAQVIIDQFISSSESKWQRISALVMLLPHGYEGQGPEHSSARLERYLQLCAEENIQVCNLTTPAQYFHALRRQMRRDFKKPLVIMAPKSLLRHKECISKIEDFSDDTFHTILNDVDKPEKANRVIFCSGKVYYDLIAARKEKEIKDAAIIRMEQLYPFNVNLFKEIIKSYGKVKKLVWCQEEPKNMGAWSYISPLMEEYSDIKPIYAGRGASASPAVGSLNVHKIEQKSLVEFALMG